MRNLQLAAGVLAAVVLAAGLPAPAAAEPPRHDRAADAPAVHDRAVPGAKPVRRSANTKLSSALATCSTSKYTDPVGTPVYRVDSGCDLDQYLYADSSPLDFAIDVDRYTGPVYADGTPAPGNDLFDKNARLTLRAYDVDDDYAGTDVAREIDQVRINGHTINFDGTGGYLTGADGQWSIVTFAVPTSLLHLPSAQGQVATNAFEVFIDLGNGGSLVWAVEIDWAELRLVDDVVPSLLVHGITSDDAEPPAMADVKSFYEDHTQGKLTGNLVIPLMTKHGSLAANARILADFTSSIRESTGAGQVNFVAHSMGGLASRLYAWDHPGEARTVMMIGTPNAGSQLADILCDNRNAPWWGQNVAQDILNAATEDFGPCDGPQDGLYQLQEDYVKEVFNRQVLDVHATDYYTIAGQGNGIGSLMDGEDDGVVAVSSVRWLRPNDPSDPNPDHPGLHTPLYPAYERGHGELITEGSEALPRSLCTVYSRLYRCDSTLYGAPPGFTGGESAAAASATSATTTEVPGTVEFVGTGGAVVPADGQASINLSTDTAIDAVIIALTRTTEVSGTYNGLPMQPASYFGVPALSITGQNGAGVLQLSNSSTADVPVLAQVLGRTTRAVTVTPPASLARAGSVTSVTVGLSDAQPDEQMHYQATDAQGQVIASGLAITAGTGSWTASFTPATAGNYQVTAWTEGAGARSNHAVIPVAASDGRRIEPTGSTATGYDDNGDTVLDGVRATIPITAPAGGQFRLSARLVGPTGQPVATAGTTVSLSPGTQSVDLQFPGQDIYHSRIAGPYTVTDAVLSTVSDLEILDQATNLATTPTYAFDTFDHFPVEIDTRSFTDNAVDTNADRSYDQLTITGKVNVDTAGTYAINARLLAGSDTQVAETQQTISLAAGQNTFTLTFPWTGIRTAGIDGPFTVADLSIYNTSAVDGLGFLTTAHRTAAYPASGVVNKPPSLTASPVTLEGNTTGGYHGAIPGVSASDPDGDAVTLTNTAPDPVPLGTTSVHWTGTDTFGATATADQDVTVRDTTPPTIQCPPNVSSSSSTPQLGSPTIADIVDNSVTVTNDAPATFPAGTTNVTWRAQDDSGNTSTCVQTVAVTTASLYSFNGFYVNETYCGNFVWVSSMGTWLTIGFSLTDDSGTRVTSLSAVKAYGWQESGGNVGTLSYNSSKQQYEIQAKTSPQWYEGNFEVTLADGSVHVLKLKKERIR